MFSKKMLWVTLLSLFAQLVFMNASKIPAAWIKPLLITGAIIAALLLYAWSQGMLTEQKVVEKIAEHTNDPLMHMRERTPEEKEMIARYAQKAKKTPTQHVSGDAVPM